MEFGLLILILVNEAIVMGGLVVIVRALLKMTNSLTRTEQMTARILTHFPETNVVQ